MSRVKSVAQDLLAGNFQPSDNDIGQAAKWQQFKVSLMKWHLLVVYTVIPHL